MKENSAGPEKSNANFIKGIFEPQIIESRSKPVTAKIFLCFINYMSFTGLNY